MIGTWELLEWDCTIDDTYHSHPFGADAQGRITYTNDGYMSAILMKPNRPRFARPLIAAGTEEEKMAALAGYVSYAGTYRVEENLVFHTVQFSLLPNWIGTDLVREMTWLPAEDGEPLQLMLSTLPEKTRSGKSVINRLRWGRLS